MYRAATAETAYCVKALNPQVMERETALANFIFSEDIAEKYSKTVAAVTALRFRGRAVQRYEGQFYLIYPYVEGVCLDRYAVTAAKAAAIGAALAALHGASAPAEPERDAPMDFDCAALLEAARRQGLRWATLDEAALRRWYAAYLRAREAGGGDYVISHRDLEPKNVLWQGESPLIIDWEAAGAIRRDYDLVETAVNWSRTPNGLSRERYQAFLAAYAARARVTVEPDAALGHLYTLIEWLIFSMRRSFGVDSADEAERELGSRQVLSTAAALETLDSYNAALREWTAEVLG